MLCRSCGMVSVLKVRLAVPEAAKKTYAQMRELVLVDLIRMKLALAAALGCARSLRSTPSRSCGRLLGARWCAHAFLRRLGS